MLPFLTPQVTESTGKVQK